MARTGSADAKGFSSLSIHLLRGVLPVLEARDGQGSIRLLPVRAYRLPRLTIGRTV